MKRSFFRLGFGLFVTSALSTAAAQIAAFTVEQILSSPFPYSLTCSPREQRVAWVFNDRGIRNIWVAEGPDFKARQLTKFDRDDGQEIAIQGFTHDGAFLVFSRGGEFNPAHLPQGTGGSKLLSVDWSGEQMKEIASVATVALSPTEDRVAFIEKGAVWIASAKGNDKPEKILELRGSLSQLKWSPDGQKLVFRSSRGSFPHQYSFIVLFDLTSKNLSYLAPSVYLDSAPVWSPEGKAIAFLRRLSSGRRSVLTADRFPEPDPWEIRVYDLAQRSSHSVWRSPEGDSFWAVELAWLDEQRLVFTSEQDGWRHLYSVAVQGGTPEQLSKGEFEVESFTVLPKMGKVIASCNKDDADRRHLWMVGPGQPMQALTTGESIEWSPSATAGELYVAFLASDGRTPAHLRLMPVEGGASLRLAPETLPSDFPLEQLVAPRPVIFRAADGTEIHGQLFLPPLRFSGKRPAVMYFHGGPVRQMLLGWHYSSYYHRAYAFNQFLASRGYLVLSVNYRLGIGYGRKFRDVPDGGPRGASEYQDLLAGARFLRSMSEVDASRIGLWGGSYGGLMTALGLARNSDLFAAGVDLHGVHDWNQWQAWSERGENDHERTAWKSSPVADLESWRSPVLLIHGDDDRNVPFSETVWLAQELEKRGVEHELLLFPDEIHGFLLHQNWVKAFEAAADFLDRKLNQAVSETGG